MVFAKKEKAQRVEDYPLYYILHKKEVRGDIGIEVEVEGKNLPKETTTPTPWVYKRDGSLRGADNAEYVLGRPIKFEEVDGAIEGLWEAFEGCKSVLDDSNRTSIHVHLNITPFYMNRLASLMGLWFIFEDLLSHWCGEHRVGNLFALRAKDAPNIVRRCAEFIKNDGGAISEGHHYAAMSPYAMMKFGSLEFRLLRGVSDPEVLKTWVAILKKLYDASEGYKDPTGVVTELSYNGPSDFFRNTFGGDLAESIQDAIGWDSDQLRESLYEGVRLAQEITYARDWSNFNPTKVVQDPFGRTTKKARSLNFVHFDEATSPSTAALQAARSALRRQAQRAMPAPTTADANWLAQVTNTNPFANPPE